MGTTETVFDWYISSSLNKLILKRAVTYMYQLNVLTYTETEKGRNLPNNKQKQHITVHEYNSKHDVISETKTF